jgi:SAM-dependent methyltransferase
MEEGKMASGDCYEANGNFSLDEAVLDNENYNHRHRVVNHKLGVWRWRGMQQHRKRILNIIENSNYVVDFGGAASPLGLGSVVVDILESADYNNIEDLPKKADVVFSSHCLEHIPDLDGTLSDIKNSMNDDGYLITFVPSWTCERWRAGVHKESRGYNDHAWTFGLSTEEVPYMGMFLFIDDVIGRYFSIEHASQCGDNSIFVLAKKI